MKKILFVCSGNTCRSPMAEAVFNDSAEREGVDAHASSAGLFTRDGLAYSDNSAAVLKDEGIELSGSSRQITESMVKESGAVFGLTSSIAASLIAAFPKYADKIYSFPVEVADPFGGDIVEYKRALGEIKDGIGRIIAALKDGKI